MDAILKSPPTDGDRDRGSTVAGLYWTFLVVCFFLMGLRFWARIKIHALGPDDWTMAFAVLILLAATVTGTLMVLNGGCRHIYYLALDKGQDGIIKVNRLFIICQPFAIMGIAIGRISVALLVLRIMAVTVWRKRFLWFTIVSTFIISALNSVLLFVNCSPTAAAWNPFIPYTCWDVYIITDVTIVASGWNVLMDFFFAILPISIFWNLKVSVKKRVGLSVLTGMGVLAGISGAVKASKLYESQSIDSTWATYDLLLWNGAETFLIIMCGCLPTLRPLYVQFFGQRGKSAGAEPIHEQRVVPHMKKNSDGSDSNDGDRHYRYDPKIKPSIESSITRVGHSLNIDVWTEGERNEMMPIESPHGTQLDGSHSQPTSREALEV